jgi:hypothetical protein
MPQKLLFGCAFHLAYFQQTFLNAFRLLGKVAKGEKHEN